MPSTVAHAVRLKEILGGPLSDQELMCLQIEQNGFGCGTCSTEVRPADPGVSQT